MNIYSIEFERTCYVGISKTPKDRLSQHIGYAITNPEKNEKSKWFFSMYERDIKPELIILETDVIDIAERETYWIEQKRSEGFTVINVRKGGGGCKELTDDQKSKIALNRKPKTISNRLRQANSERSKGRVKSEATLEKLRIAHTGKLHSEETKNKISESKIGITTITESGRLKISEAHKGKLNSEETKLKKSIAKSKYWEESRNKTLFILQNVVDKLKDSNITMKITKALVSKNCNIPITTIGRYWKLLKL